MTLIGTLPALIAHHRLGHRVFEGGERLRVELCQNRRGTRGFGGLENLGQEFDEVGQGR